MRKKTGLTIVERATIAVPGFETVAKKLEQQVTLRGQSKSTLQNYIRRIALFSLHFGRLPEQIGEDEINEYTWQHLLVIPGLHPGAALSTWYMGCGIIIDFLV
jgi:hypothetical protein